MAVNTEVQAELQAYLTEKGINNLFVKIVENLLLHTPDNPVRYVIEYLKENFPDETSGIVIESGPAIAKGGHVDLSGGLSDDSDYTSDEDDEAPTELPAMAPPKSKGRRRVSVSAESVDPDKMKASFEKKVNPKSDEEKAQIREILQKFFLFRELDEEQTTIIVDAMFPVSKKKDDVLIEQGAEGDNFYMVVDGEAEVTVKDKESGETKVVANCKKDQYFGELALMYNAPRAATVTVISDELKLWALDRMTFKMIMMDSTMKKRQKYRGFIKNVEILASLDEKERNKITDTLQVNTFEDGQTIIKQGDAGEVFYIIEKGEVVCTQSMAAGEAPIEVCRLTEGSYFGEIALLTDRPRQATVTAVGAVRCLCLDRKTFKRVMGPLVTILRRNLSLYNNFMAQKI